MEPIPGYWNGTEFSMKQIVTLLAVFCLTQTAAAADVFVKCFNHQGHPIFSGVLKNRLLNANGVGGGVIIAGESKIRGKAYSLSQEAASTFGIRPPAKCNIPFLRLYESTSEKVTLVCASAELTGLMSHMPADESQDLNQRSVRERLAGPTGLPECTVVLPSEKMDSIRAVITNWN
jgi:hypothetical protein